MKFLKVLFVIIDVLLILYFGLLIYFKKFDFLKTKCKAKYEVSYVIFNNEKFETKIYTNYKNYEFNFLKNYKNIEPVISEINSKYKTKIDSENIVMLHVFLDSKKANIETDNIIGVFVYEKKYLIFNSGYGYYFKNNKAVLYKNSNFITTKTQNKYINKFIEPIEFKIKKRLDVFNQRKFTDNDYFFFSNYKGKIVVGI